MTNLFENISDKNIEKLKRILKANTVNYKKNVNVLSNVNRDDFIAIIDTGSVQLVFNDYDGNKTILEEIPEGKIFGSDDGTVEDPEGGDDNPNGGGDPSTGGSGQASGGDSGSGSGNGGSGSGSGSVTPTVNAPNFSGATQFEESTQVSMTGPTGSEIHYTLD